MKEVYKTNINNITVLLYAVYHPSMFVQDYLIKCDSTSKNSIMLNHYNKIKSTFIFKPYLFSY